MHTIEHERLSLALCGGNCYDTKLESWTPDWPSLCDQLSKPKIGQKDGPYFIRAEGTIRSNAGTSDVANIVIIDGDSLITEAGEIIPGAPHPNEVHSVLAKLGLKHLIYTSHSNDADYHKYRLVLPCTYNREQLPALLDYIFSELHKAGVMLADVKENRTWAQAWYFPRVPDQRRLALFKFLSLDGKILNAGRITPAWLKDKTPIAGPIPATSQPKGKKPITAFNEMHNIAEILLRNEYIKKGERFLRPNSESKIPGVRFCSNCADGVERIYSDGNDVLNDGNPHDVFDVFCLLEHGGDRQKALEKIKNENKHNIEISKTSYTSITPIIDAASRECKATLKSTSNPNKVKNGAESVPSEPPTNQAEPKKEQKNYGKPPKEASIPDSILAEQIAEELKDVLIFDDVSTEWFCCCDGLWRPTTPTRALKKIDETLHKFAQAGFSNSKLNGVESLLRLYLNLTEWQTNRRFLPMKNGMYDIETGDLTDYTPDSKFTWQLPYTFAKTAQIDAIATWLYEVCCGEQETINIIRAFMKLAMTGSDVQKFLEVIGPGGSGKSTLIWLIIELIGEVNHAVSDLKNLEMNRFETAGLYRKKLAVINDSSRYNGDVSVLKALTGGDPVRLERKNKQQSGSFVFDGVVTIVSNEAIQATDYTSGLARRRLPIYFNKKSATLIKRGGTSLAALKIH